MKIRITGTKQTREVFVSVTDVDAIELYSWLLYYKRNGTLVPKARVRNKLTTMHRYILEITDPKVLVDHVNGNTLDNRRINLRICSNSENLRNRGKNSNNKSGYKGVSWSSKKGKWIAQIKINYKTINLGSFDSAKDAHESYKVAATKLHGEFVNHG